MARSPQPITQRTFDVHLADGPITCHGTCFLEKFQDERGMCGRLVAGPVHGSM